eukprot:2798965-Rhodomonas_salina.3
MQHAGSSGKMIMPERRMKFSLLNSRDWGALRFVVAAVWICSLCVAGDADGAVNNVASALSGGQVQALITEGGNLQVQRAIDGEGATHHVLRGWGFEG